MRAVRCWLVAGALLGAIGCEESVAPTGPANCEPPEELVIERKLKEGYRAAAEGTLQDADLAFREALELAPEHPEALAGRRLVKELLRRGPRPTVKPPTATEP